MELHNIQHLCPLVAIILSTPVEKPTEIFVDGQVLWSEETQGNPPAMSMYALATIPFIDQLSDIQDVTQVWYANDASAAGSLTSNLKWYNHTNS